MATFSSNVMNITGPIQHKRATEAVLEASSYIAAAGELLTATDTGLIKVGDGEHTWAELPVPSSGVEIVNDYTETTTGKALDAVRGKDLNDRIEAIEDITEIDCGEITA